MEEQHIYYHTANDKPRLSVKAEKNSKGYNFEASVSNAENVEEAMKLLAELTSALEAKYNIKELA